MKLRALLALAILILARTPARGQTQTTGQISGTVTDPSGGVVPKAQVTVSNLNTGIKRATESNSDGHYLVPLLDPGTYLVTVEAKGFETVSRDGVTVAVSRYALVDFRLQIGAEAIKVTISTAAPLIEPSNSNTTTTFNATQLANIPNAGNDLSYLANLAPGAVMNTYSAGGISQGNVEINGLGSVANDFTIDGLDANEPYNNFNATGASGLQLGLNAIQEVTINSTAFSVDQGRLYGSAINYITKSGTNAFHGNAFEIWNGSAMNARNFFLNANGVQQKPRSNVNEFGASLGGPIRKDKLFFFSDLEGIRVVLPVVLKSTLPTPAYERYVLQQLPLGGADTVLGGTLPPEPEEVGLYQKMFSLMGDTSRGVPYGAIPGCPLNADGSPVAGSPPSGDGCANIRTFSASPSANETLFTTKLDYILNANDSFWFRFQLNDGQSVQVDPVNSVFNSVLRVPSRSGAAGWTHVFSPHLVNQFNPGISYLPGITNLANPAGGHAALPITYNASPFSIIGNNAYSTPFGVTSTTWQLNDSLSWDKGRNAYKFGVNMRRLLITTTSAFDITPFENTFSLPEFTFGATASTSQAFVQSVEDQLRVVNLDTYAMDTLRATSKLTVTIGLRASWNSNPVSRNHGFTYLNGESFETMSHDVNRALKLDILPNQQHMFISTPLLRWAPRAAIAYTLRPSTIVRAGFGLFYQPSYNGLSPQVSQNIPTNTQFSAGIFTSLGGVAIAPGVPNSAVDVAVAANQQFQSGFANGELSCGSSLASPSNCLPPVNFNAFAGNTGGAPYSLQWSTSLEQQLGQSFALTAKYVGTRYVKGLYTTYDNLYQTICAGCFPPLPFNAPPDSRFGTVNTSQSGANSSYHGLTVTVEKRFSYGLQFQANYTYSHCLDDQSNAVLTSFNSNVSQISILPRGVQSLHGDCDYDVRHSLNGSYVYQLPFRSSRAWLQTMIGGWQISGTLFVRGGFPISVYSSPNFSGVFNPFGSVYANLVPNEPLYQKTPVASTPPGTIQWLNPDAFQSTIDPSTGMCYPSNSPQNCQNGLLARGALRAPGFRWTDLDLAKQFKVSEHMNLKFETQFYNLFNHPNFGIPNSGFSLAGIPSEPATLTGFGTISQTVSPSTGLLGGRLGGDSSVRMIAFRGTIVF
jgi:Carboxypeptidase regulatory-like domain